MKARKTRAPRGSVEKEEREPTNVTAGQLVLLHEYCWTTGDIATQLRYQNKRTGNLHIPTTMASPICLHPSHHWCSHKLPTDNELEEVNARLSGQTSGGVPLTERVINKLAAEAERGYDLDKVRKGRVRRVKNPAVSRALRYWCLQCKEWHLNTQTDHLKHKRGRGRPAK